MSNPNQLVSQYLIHKVQQHLHDFHVVVWFDPEQQYSALAEAQNFPETQVARYDPRQGFFALRRQIEPIWGVVDAPQLLIYVPLAESDAHHALIEYSTAGVTLQPGQHPVEQNTRLEVIAKQALTGILPASNLANMVASIEKGQLSLTELDEMATRYKETNIGILTLIYKSESVEDICLEFLSSSKHDTDLGARNAVAMLITLLQTEFDLAVEEKDPLPKIREKLIRHVLLTEFVTALGNSLPPSLRTFRLPTSKAALEATLHIAKVWRQRNDTVSSYLDAAGRIEPTLGLAQHNWTRNVLEDLETFSSIDAILQALIEKELIDKPTTQLIEISQRRQSMFWSEQNPVIKMRWQLVIEAGQVLVYCMAIKTLLKQDWEAAQLVQHYTGVGSKHSGKVSPWWTLDTAFRRLERDEHSFDFETEPHNTLQKLLAAARTTYSETIHSMTEWFIRSYEKASFHLSEFPQQASIFHDFVQPAVDLGKTAYILVDSFRYEMAMDLLEQIQTGWKCQITAAIATPPTITEVGMAALMPNAEKGLMLTAGGPGKLNVVLQKNSLKGRADRMKAIESVIAQSAVLELSQIAPLKDKKVITALASSKLTVITATDEIDGMWESEPEIARRLHDDVFTQLRRGIRNLLNAGFQTIIVTSDHGFIAGDDLMTGAPMDPPGGETIDLHRRVWVGHGGADIPGCLRKPIAVFGLDGDLELVTPMGLGCFKVAGGSSQYFHGGLSLQEMVIPIITIKSSGAQVVRGKEQVFDWKITLGSKQISTRFYTVTVDGNATDLLSTPPKIRIELIAGQQVVSTQVAATYGLDDSTKDISLKMEEGSTVFTTNTVTLFIDEVPTGTIELDLNLIDSDSGLLLYHLHNIPIAITF